MTTYEDRPWLALYDQGVPADPVLPVETGMAMFDRSLAARPDSPLLHYFDSTLSLRQVDEDSRALAAGLARLYGVGKGDRVMIQVQNIPAFVISMLAAWRLGAILVPLNPMFRKEEVTKLATDAEPAVFILLDSLVESLGPTIHDLGVPIVSASELDYLDAWPADAFGTMARTPSGLGRDIQEIIADHRGDHLPDVDLTGDDIAFLVYTSGTTGPPKGAMNTHRGVVFNSENYRSWCHLTDEDVCLGIAPLFHVTGLIAHIGVALLLPMPLLLGYRFNTVVMARLIEQYRATWVMGSITAYIALMNDPTIHRFDLSSLSKLWSGGQAVSPTTVEQLEHRFGAYVHNLYGLTEVTSESHAVPAGKRAPVDPATGALSVGPPVSGYLVRVVDDEGNEVPVGEVGELVIESASVVPGYWNKPDDTRASMPGGRLRTGDVGFMDRQGWFYIVDRKKDLIIASGFKIWPREVEDVLYSHPDVREVGVVGVPDEYRGETVVGFVSLKAGASATADTIQSYCRERLAAYKCPTELTVVDEIPKNPNGKILRRELKRRSIEGEDLHSNSRRAG